MEYENYYDWRLLANFFENYQAADTVQAVLDSVDDDFDDMLSFLKSYIKIEVKLKNYYTCTTRLVLLE